MNIEDLNAKITALMNEADRLTGPERALLRIEIRNLQNDIDGASNQDILKRLNAIKLPDLREIDQQIEAAKSAASDAAKREAIGVALKVLRVGLGFVL
ncbi:MAG: hypothetical protein JJ959_18035 [Nisaea sp.]|uniref:hypothetical protein n=1 Tax=Nisaea sp. TaxID=2024842 RepID=UPI001B212889|nr:hypothetical protein [Nisaea sp.]MBO6562451.1 hypothetical protein [Nisaea sp.]